MITYINDGFAKAGFGSIAQQLDNLKYTINDAFTAIGPVVSKGTEVALQYLKQELPTIKKVCSDVKSSLMPFFQFLEDHKDGVRATAKALLYLWAAIKAGSATVKTITTISTGWKTFLKVISKIGVIVGVVSDAFSTLAIGAMYVGDAITGIAGTIGALIAAASPITLVVIAIGAAQGRN